MDGFHDKPLQRILWEGMVSTCPLRIVTERIKIVSLSQRNFKTGNVFFQNKRGTLSLLLQSYVHVHILPLCAGHIFLTPSPLGTPEVIPFWWVIPVSLSL